MRTLAILPLFLLALCDSGIEWRSAPYEAYWIDSRSNVALGRVVENGWIGRVDAPVVAAGRNDRYLTAIRETEGGTEFYYLEIAKDDDRMNADEVTQGPYTQGEFNELLETLGLPVPNRF